MLLSEVLAQQITFIKPNLELEWMEAIRYPFLTKLGKKGWMKLASTGKPVEFTAQQLAILDNSTALDCDSAKEEWPNLEQEKRDRVSQLQSMEMPIVLNIHGKYELLAGNTRLTWLVAHQHPVTVWMINV